MRKIKLILFFLISAATLSAQVNYNWYPVHPNSQYNYKADTSALPFSVVIKADSITGPQQVYHLNKIVTRCDTCLNSLLANDPFDSTYTLVRQPQFLGHSFSKVQGNIFYFKGPKRFTLQPFNAVGAAWIFDSLQNISATILFKTAQPVLGALDSLCVIKLSTTDTIILSKSFGIIQFPFKTISQHSYRLAGLEGAVNAGTKLRRFHNFFDFNVGDVLQYAFEDDDYNDFPPLFTGGRERWDFLSVTVFSDSVCYSIRQNYLDSSQFGGGTPAITAYTQTLNITFTDSAKHMANLYPLQEIMVNPFYVYNNGIRSIHKITMHQNNQGKIIKRFGQNCPGVFLSGGMTGAASETAFTDIFLNQNSSHIVGRELTEGLGFTSELFNNYDRISQRCLIGYIKGADTSGTIYGDIALSVKTNSALRDPYAIYPVPANELLSIKGLLNAGTQINVMNTVGETVYAYTTATTQLAHQINTSALANGLYFIVISNSHSNNIKKLVIAHSL